MFRMNLFLDIVRRNERMMNTARTVYDVDDVDGIEGVEVVDGVDHNQNGMSPFVHDPSENYPRPTLQRPIIGI